MPPPAAAVRPTYLNPLKVRLPVTAIVSLAHRISGILLVLAVPWLVHLLSVSLTDAAALERGLALLRSVPGRLVLLVLTWCLAHHVAAGVRHLLFDAGCGTGYVTARSTAWAVHGVALLVTLGAALALSGVLS